MSMELWEKCVDFHGHRCGGLRIGYAAAKYAMDLLNIRFSDNERMWFRGYNNFPIAFVEVQLFGSASNESCTKMTKEICRIFKEELGINPEHTYVKYEFIEEWGWNNENL